MKSGLELPPLSHSVPDIYRWLIIIAIYGGTLARLVGLAWLWVKRRDRAAGALMFVLIATVAYLCLEVELNPLTDSIIRVRYD